MSRTRSKAQSQEDANATPVNSTDAHSGIGVINVGGMMTLAVVGIVALVIVAATAFVLAQNSSSPQAVASVAQQVQPAQQVAPQVPSSAQAQAKPPPRFSKSSRLSRRRPRPHPTHKLRPSHPPRFSNQPAIPGHRDARHPISPSPLLRGERSPSPNSGADPLSSSSWPTGAPPVSPRRRPWPNSIRSMGTR